MTIKLKTNTQTECIDGQNISIVLSIVTLKMFVSVSHNVFGILHTVNSANYVYFVGLQKLQELDHPDVNKLFTGDVTNCKTLSIILPAMYAIFHNGWNDGQIVEWREREKCFI